MSFLKSLGIYFCFWKNSKLENVLPLRFFMLAGGGRPNKQVMWLCVAERAREQREGTSIQEAMDETAHGGRNV